jgi:hypothetical protein
MALLNHSSESFGPGTTMGGGDGAQNGLVGTSAVVKAKGSAAVLNELQAVQGLSAGGADADLGGLHLHATSARMLAAEAKAAATKEAARLRQAAVVRLLQLSCLGLHFDRHQ